jgi:hypothetical protein
MAGPKRGILTIDHKQLRDWGQKILATSWPCRIFRDLKRAAKPLKIMSFWWSRWDSNPRPLRCENGYRQKRKLLPFRKLQPPREINGFHVLSHSLPRVQVMCCYFWPHIGHLKMNAFRLCLREAECVMENTRPWGYESSFGQRIPTNPKK